MPYRTSPRALPSPRLADPPWWLAVVDAAGVLAEVAAVQLLATAIAAVLVCFVVGVVWFAAA